MSRQALISGTLVVLLALTSSSWAQSNAPSGHDAQRQRDYWNQKYYDAMDARDKALTQMKTDKTTAAESLRQAEGATGEDRTKLLKKADDARQDADWELRRSAVHREEMDEAERQLDMWDEYLRSGTLSEGMTLSDGKPVVTSTESSPATTPTTGGLIQRRGPLGVGPAPEK
jgi:hypothetical protein